MESRRRIAAVVSVIYYGLCQNQACFRDSSNHEAAGLLPIMDITAAIDRVTLYVQENQATLAITTASLATMGFPAIITTAVFSAAGLTANGPVAGMPSCSTVA